MRSKEPTASIVRRQMRNAKPFPPHVDFSRAIPWFPRFQKKAKAHTRTLADGRKIKVKTAWYVGYSARPALKH
jgi:hypothetical protein